MRQPAPEIGLGTDDRDAVESVDLIREAADHVAVRKRRVGRTRADLPQDVFAAEDVRPSVDIDLGRVTFTTDGGEATEWFPNIAESGLGADVVKVAERLPRGMGRSRYLAGFWITLARFKATTGTVVCDTRTYEGRITNLVVANCQFFGGGMHVAPKATPTDGRLDVLIQIGTKADYVSAITKVFKGKHIPSPVIKEYRARRVEVTTKTPLRVEADGELLGTTPATFQLYENALRLKV